MKRCSRSSPSGLTRRRRRHRPTFRRRDSCAAHTSPFGVNADSSSTAQCAKRGPAIKPRTGDAILFWDMKLTGEDDESSMHASCPVIKGEKWTATKWCAARGAACRAASEPACTRRMHTSKFKGLQEGIPNTCDDKQPEDCQKARRSNALFTLHAC